MFERTRVDNMVQSQQVAVPAELTLDDQTVLKGDLMMPAARPVHEVLNGSNVFLDFRVFGGEQQLLAKSAIRSIRLIQVPSANQMRAAAARSGETFDPHTVLGVRVDASHEEVRKAYVEMAKIYHPDRYATAQLPNEVREYLAAMSRRVNLAFQALEKAHRVVVKQSAPVAEPIYTSRPRG